MLRSSDRWEFRVQACAGSVFMCVQAPCSGVCRLRVHVCTGSVFRCVQAPCSGVCRLPLHQNINVLKMIHFQAN